MYGRPRGGDMFDFLEALEEGLIQEFDHPVAGRQRGFTRSWKSAARRVRRPSRGAALAWGRDPGRS